MAMARRFENLVVWQKARTLTRGIYAVCRKPPLASDHDLVRQIRSATVSVMANVAEGFERTSRRELLHFLSIAKASCGEVRSHLYVALDANYLDHSDFEQIKAEAEQVSRMIAGLQSSVRKACTGSSRRR
ncbi:MAG: four helix bundle protein [Gemmatimonadales bacterium]|nr:four helix bundle protein [Gemmatimonadales bacterium]MDQ3428188.1 four helix bundle protein [Gemmatimonadota bacterium]